MTLPAAVRIVLVRTARTSGGEPASSARGEAASSEPVEAPSPALAALERLGAEVQVEPVPTLADARARCLEEEVDLLVVEPGAPPVELARWLEAGRHAGPPVLMVTGPDDGRSALDWFRCGAADCVSQEAAEEALPVAALDLIRRHRAQARERRAEERVDRLRRYTRNIIQNINSALLVVDREGRVRYANAPAEELLAEPGGALVGRSALSWFESPEGPDIPLTRSIEKGERFRGAEAVLRRADGERVPVAVFCGPMRDERGRDLGAVAIFQDLSEMRRLQRQLFQSEKMASIGQLAAGVAHEINNPVGFIDANLFQMEEYGADFRKLWRRVRRVLDAAGPAGGSGDDAELRSELEALRAEAEEIDADFVLDDLGKAIRESREGSERIRHIVQDLRAFAREDGAERIHADVNQCVDSTANIVWSMMKHAVVLSKDYGELPSVLCHPGQLRQVIMNLLMNAYQAVVARRSGSGELGQISLRTSYEGGEVVIEVEDDGVGIAPEHLSRIFDPFFTTKEPGEGTGLGLSSAFHLVTSLGGRLEADSREGEGARFRVSLPAAEGSPPRAAGEPS